MSDNYSYGVDYKNIPQRLTMMDTWILWQIEYRKDKATKVPKNAEHLYNASTIDSKTWTNFKTAKARHDELKKYGLGFVLDGSGIVAIDIDN